MGIEPLALPYPMRRCGKRTRAGGHCKSWAIQGGMVCRMHGGAAPQVKRAAEERIRELVDPALNRLAKLIDDLSAPVALAAVKDVLDRAGYGAKQRIELTIRQQAEKLAADLGLDVDELIAEAERIVASAK